MNGNPGSINGSWIYEREPWDLWMGTLDRWTGFLPTDSHQKLNKINPFLVEGWNLWTETLDLWTGNLNLWRDPWDLWTGTLDLWMGFLLTDSRQRLHKNNPFVVEGWNLGTETLNLWTGTLDLSMNRNPGIYERESWIYEQGYCSQILANG